MLYSTHQESGSVRSRSPMYSDVVGPGALTPTEVLYDAATTVPAGGDGEEEFEDLCVPCIAIDIVGPPVDKHLCACNFDLDLAGVGGEPAEVFGGAEDSIVQLAEPSVELEHTLEDGRFHDAEVVRLEVLHEISNRFDFLGEEVLKGACGRIEAKVAEDPGLENIRRAKSFDTPLVDSP